MNTKKYIVAVIRYKVYIDRFRAYLGYINFVMILFVFLESYKETNFGRWFYSNTIWTIPLSIVTFISVALLWGYFDKRYIRPQEHQEIQSANPYFMDMYSKINEIYKTTRENDILK